MKKQNKTFKIILALCCFLAFSASALAVQNPPVTGIGVVVKKNPGGGASKAITDKEGNFSLEMVKGSYLISLDKEQLMKVGQEMVKTLNPKSNNLFNGDGTQLVIAENTNIIMSQLDGDVNSDLILITVLKTTTLRGTILWDDSVINQPQQSANYVGHVTLLKRNASQKLMVFCPTGTVGLEGKCVPIKDLENLPQGKSADYVGHVTLLKKNGKVSLANIDDKGTLPGANKTEGIGHVTLLKKNITAIRVKPGTECPEGFELKNGECLPITTVTTTSKTDGIGHVTLLKKNITAIRVTPGTDCPEGLVLKNGECVQITTVTTASEVTGGPIQGTVVKGGTNGGTHKVKRTGHVTLMRFTQIYLGGGIFNPTRTTKEAGIVNGIDLNLSVYQPIWFWETTSLGINVGGSYTMGNGEYTLDKRYTVYQLQGQSAPPVVAEKGAGSPKNQGFKFETGAQMNIHLGDVTVSPIFNVGYLNVEQKSFTVTETVQENTVDYPYVLLDQKATKTNGLGIIPKVRLAYNITPRIGIWVEGSYIMGPKIKTESTRFVLDPSIPNDSYNLGHFQEGQYITSKSETKYSGIGINGGIVIGLGNTSKVLEKIKEREERFTTLQSGGNSLFKCSCCSLYFDTAVLAATHKATCSSCTTTTTSTIRIKVPNTGTIRNTEVTVLGNGETTSNGTPIVGRTIIGTIKGLKKPAEIKITQEESNDIGTATTDEKGNFRVEVATDTVHKVFINDVEYGKVKVINNQPTTGTVGLNPGVIPQRVHTRVFCEDGKKVMKYYNAQGLVSSSQIIYSDIPCNESTWPINGIEGDLSVFQDSETGTITHFTYENDYLIDNLELASVLNVKSFVIKRGIYQVQRKASNDAGKLLLVLKEPIPVTDGMMIKGKLFEGTNPKGMDCLVKGNSCFYVSGEKNKANLQPFILTPIIEKGLCTKIEVQYRGSGSPKQQGF